MHCFNEEKEERQMHLLFKDLIIGTSSYFVAESATK
jgi:hypothetical protein